MAIDSAICVRLPASGCLGPCMNEAFLCGGKRMSAAEQLRRRREFHWHGKWGSWRHHNRPVSLRSSTAVSYTGVRPGTRRRVNDQRLLFCVCGLVCAVSQIGSESVKSTGSLGYLLWRSIYLTKQVWYLSPSIRRVVDTLYLSATSVFGRALSSCGCRFGLLLPYHPGDKNTYRTSITRVIR